MPDQYIQLVRFDGYKQREGEPDGYGGARKQYLDEIRFVPVSNANTRTEAAVAGQFDYVDSLPVESLDKLKGGRSDPVMLKPFGWPRLVLNTKQGIMSNLAVRQAVQLALNEEDMLFAAFGNKEFYKLNGDLYPEGYPWATSLGGKVYNKADTAAAKKLLDGANVADKKIRILTSQQYEFHYKMALVAAEYLKAAGFTVDMQVVDWATLTQRRQDPAVWDIFITHSVFLPEPALIDFPSRTRRAGGTRRAAPRSWTRTTRRAPRKNASSAGPTCSRPCMTRSPSSRSGTSTPRARARRRCRAPSRRRGRSSGMPGRAPSKRCAGRRAGRAAARPLRECPEFSP